MGTEVLLATAATVVSLYAALFHAWVFALHPRAREHLWVAITATGAAGISFGTGMLYAGSDAHDALEAHRVTMAGASFVMVGALDFSASRMRVQIPYFLRSARALSAAVLLLVIFAPQLLYAVDRPPRETVVFGLHFLQLEFTPLLQGLLAVGLVYFLFPLLICSRARLHGEPGATPLLVAFAVWMLAALHDTAIGAGLYDAPFVLATGGYMLIAGTLSALLVRDLVRAMDESERLGAQLQEQAETRAGALRAIDLRLARGEQLAAIGMLAAGVAHEINNPLAYVSANLNQLRALWEEEPDPDEVKEILAESREGLARVGAIVTDLLRMARDGANEQEVCDLGEVVRSVLPLVVREAGDAIEVATEIEAPLPVWGSARLLGQVALNLALNALHAVADGADRKPRVLLRARVARGGVELSVDDNGAGIPAEVLDQIFEPSFTTKAEQRGTGLGLALTRLVVTRHQGEIDVQSSPAGTLVTVWLPAASPPPRVDAGIS
jgi:signal transduction histidine kinase